MIWVVFALMTGAVVFCVLWPLARAPRGVSRRRGDVDFYKAQLAGIDRDFERGLASAQEAESARARAAHRLLEADRQTPPPPPASPFARRLAALVALTLIPTVSLLLYLHIGSPGFPDEPLSARLSAAPRKMDVSVMLARIEKHLAQHPDDGRGWELIAPVYLQLGRPRAAARAYTHAISTLGDSATRENALGTALVYANGGQIDDRARQAFETALRLDPHALGPQYYLGLAAAQVGDKGRAVALWSKLLTVSPPGAPWIAMVRARIAQLGGKPPKTQAGEIAAMAPGPQAAMIHAMVDRLATRLAQKGGGVQDWLRLVRAYVVLHQTDKARKALADARKNLNSDRAAIAQLDALARQLGLES
ncbi:MAG TPA: c-type cytochrome biogenesis protein CcmI [Beijerinckiaceae bacterium]|nr:c-type cytochrome biogenesis protein CcmI [Beijerinckiaceae bacterium]